MASALAMLTEAEREDLRCALETAELLTENETDGDKMQNVFNIVNGLHITTRLEARAEALALMMNRPTQLKLPFATATWPPRGTSAG